MAWKIRSEMLPDAQRLAIYSVLFSAAFADRSVHYREVEVIRSSLGDLLAEPPRIRDKIRRFHHSSSELTEVTQCLCEGGGDLGALVFLMVLDVLAADDVIALAEARFAKAIFEALGVASMPENCKKPITKRLQEIRRLVAMSQRKTLAIVLELIRSLDAAEEPAETKADGSTVTESLDDKRLAAFLDEMKERRRRARTRQLFSDLG